jgi:hypothetical protein
MQFYFHAALILNTSEVDHHLLSCTVPHQGDRKESRILVKQLTYLETVLVMAQVAFVAFSVAEVPLGV